MASKKYKLVLLGFLVLIGSGVFAQKSTSVYDPYDTTVITPKGLPQQNEFWNHNYDFPAKPRNQWEVGASIGAFTESSDVPARIPTGGFEAHVRKAVGYIFSLRAQYSNGIAEGLSWLPSSGYGNNPAWNGYTGPVFYNYRANLQDLSIDGLFSLNNVRFHKQKTGFDMYIGGGLGLTAFKTMIDAQRSNGTNYEDLFNAIYNKYAPTNGFVYANRKNILNDLKNGLNGISGLDGNYETPAETEANVRRPGIFSGYTLKPSGTLIVGVAYKLSTRINLQLEDRQIFVKSDLLDGQRYQESSTAQHAILTGDYDSYNILSLGLNFNLGSKAVEPLWWLNPLDYAYSELNNPRHIKFPKPKYTDTDGDGVIDELDKEPNTPAGCPVDTHGVSLDTDGDGVPDCKDKEKITPTYCQPVDADGVGKCPDPACCTALGHRIDSLKLAPACPADYPSVSFKGKGTGLSADAKALLATVAAKLKDNPTCNIVIVDYPAASKPHQSLAKNRLDSITKYLTETLGISTDRITTDTQLGAGNENTFDIKSK